MKTFRKKAASPSLFDNLLTAVQNETSYFTNAYSKIPEDGLVHYLDSRTGRETFTSAGRFWAISSLQSGLLKRYTGPTKIGPFTPLKDREEAAVQEFLRDNEWCKLWNDTYREGRILDPLDPHAFLVLEIRSRVKGMLAELLDGNSVSFTDMLSLITSGPGASAGVDSDGGTYSRQFNSAMSFSDTSVRDVYKASCNATYLTRLAETERQLLYGKLDAVDVPACFCSVPKTNVKNRGICTQPSGNMALQLALHKWLVRILRTIGIDLSNQQYYNKKLAQRGSRVTYHARKRTWKFCTWDLSSASNFPWMLIVDLFPPKFVEILKVLRSDYMTVEGRVVKKEMCSTMGNGFTFALMTLLLSCVVKSIYDYLDLPEYDARPLPCSGVPNPEDREDVVFKTWGVYGDDIIVDASANHLLRNVLDAFGFRVNHSKSFTKGLFRESCGGDYYDGYDVRPVFVETLDTITDIYSLANRLAEWSAKHSVSLRNSIHLLRVEAALMQPELRVPPFEDVSAGLRVPYDMMLPSIPNPWGGVSYACLRPKPSRRWVYREIHKKIKYSDIQTRKEYSYDMCVGVILNATHHPNVPGAILGMLSGEVRKGQYGVRPKTTLYEQLTVYAPSWSMRVPVEPDSCEVGQDISVLGLRAEYVASMDNWFNYQLRNMYSRQQYLVASVNNETA